MVRNLSLLGHDFELLVDAALAEWNGSADPEALALGGRNLVAHPLADHLTLELGKGEQQAHALGGVERLGDRHERNSILIEQFDQLGEVGERAGEAIDLINHHDGDLAGLRGTSAKDQDTAMTAQNLKHVTFVFERTCAAPVGACSPRSLTP
jgi:hypothetical protein